MLDPLHILPDEIYAQAVKRYRNGTSGRREAYVPITCPTCNTQRWLTVANARVAYLDNRSCLSCVNKEKYQKCVALFGRDKIQARILKSIAQRPLNRYEQAVEALLKDLLAGRGGVWYETQVIQAPFVFDFVIYSFGAPVGIIEVNGYWHKRTRQERDQRIVNIFEYEVLFLETDLITPGGANESARQLIENYLKGVLTDE